MSITSQSAGFVNADATDNNSVQEPKAGFWIRVAAYLVDALILSTIGAIVGRFFGSDAGAGASMLASLLYFVYFWTYGGSTPGLRLFHLRVVTTDGEPLTTRWAFVRLVALTVSLMLVVGVAWVGWNRNKQGLHDWIAGTYVIRDR